MQPGQLLVGGDADLLTEVLRSAAAAPAGSVCAARLAAEALMALAASGDEIAVAAVLGQRADHEVRTHDATGRGIVSVSGLSGAGAVRCFAGTAAGEGDVTVELVVYDGAGRGHTMLVRRGAEPPRLEFDEASRHRLALRRPLPGREEDSSVAALAEVLAHLPTRADIAEAVEFALADTTVEVDVAGLEGAATALSEQLEVASKGLNQQIDALAVGLSRHLERVKTDVTAALEDVRSQAVGELVSAIESSERRQSEAIIWVEHEFASAIASAEQRHSDQLTQSTASLTAALLMSEQRQVDQSAARLRDMTSAIERTVAANADATGQRLHVHLGAIAADLTTRLEAVTTELGEADRHADRRLDDLGARTAGLEADIAQLSDQIAELRRALLGC